MLQRLARLYEKAIQGATKGATKCYVRCYILKSTVEHALKAETDYSENSEEPELPI